MIRRSPAEVYIKFLLSHPEFESIEATRRTVFAKQLDWPNDEYAEGLRESLGIPDLFKPQDKLHKKSAAFLMRHQLTGFYHPTEPARMAHLLLESPRGKELIETMVLAGADPALIAHRLRSLHIHTTPSAVSLYILYYWNTDLVDLHELRALLEMRYMRDAAFPSNGQQLNEMEKLQATVVHKMRYKDRRRVILDMPMTPMAGVMNQMMMGFMPSSMELSKLAGATRSAALVRTMEALMASTHTGNATMARDYSIVAKTMTEIISEIGDAGSTLNKELQKHGVAHDLQEVPHIGQLSGGRHTTDMGPALAESKKKKESKDVGS